MACGWTPGGHHVGVACASPVISSTHAAQGQRSGAPGARRGLPRRPSRRCAGGCRLRGADLDRLMVGLPWGQRRCRASASARKARPRWLRAFFSSRVDLGEGAVQLRIEEEGVVAEAALAPHAPEDHPGGLAAEDRRSSGPLPARPRTRSGRRAPAAAGRPGAPAGAALFAWSRAGPREPRRGAKRLERTPGAPPRASTSSPESSATVGRPVRRWKYARLGAGVVFEGVVRLEVLFGSGSGTPASSRSSTLQTGDAGPGCGGSRGILWALRVATSSSSGPAHRGRSAWARPGGGRFRQGRGRGAGPARPREGVPSAVPCTSTRPPLSVATTFMSTWAAESSR